MSAWPQRSAARAAARASGWRESRSPLSQVRRGAARDRGAAAQDPGRLCHPQGRRGGDVQGDDARSRSAATSCPLGSPCGSTCSRSGCRRSEDTVRPTTFASYATHVEGHIVPALGSLQLSRVSAQAINAFYAKLLENGRLQGKGSLSPATVRRVHATLHRALKDAVRWQRLSAQSGRCRRPAEGQERTTGAARLERGAAGRLPVLCEGRSPVRPLAAALDDRLPAW